MNPGTLQRFTVQLRTLAGRGGVGADSDRELLDRFLAGRDQLAFAELVRRHGPMVLGVCRRVLRHQHDAEDAFQAAFLVLARKAAAVRHTESVAGWLFQVAFRLALRARGKGSRFKERQTAMGEPLCPPEERLLEQQETQALLDAALDELPENYRSVVVLCCLEGRTQADAARALGASADAVNSRLKRARQLLRASLRRRGVAVSAAMLTTALGARHAPAATLPLDLLVSTTRAAAGFVAGTPDAASRAAVALANGALRTMTTTRLKLLSGLFAFVALLGAAALLPAAAQGDDPPVPVALAHPRPEPAAPAAPAEPKPPRTDSMHVIILWMSGGPSQIDTFDPKPGNLNGGPFKTVNTAIKDVLFCEHLPKLAKLADRLTVIRGLSHGEADHQRGSYLMGTGYLHDNETNHPHLGSVLAKELADPKAAVPRFVSMTPPTPGVSQSNPGCLGDKYGPVRVPVVSAQFNEPKESEIDPRLPSLDEFKRVDKDNAEAMRKAVSKAFELDAEKKAVREAYGKTPFGQSCLLARRLVETGVPVIEIVLPGWDGHANNFTLVEKQCKALDPAFAQLILDLEERKLLDRTLIVWMGEFGRTPRINGSNGRDHFPGVCPVVLAGGKLKRGVVVGATNQDGTQVVERPVTVEELFATIYAAVDVDSTKQYPSNSGRPVRYVPKGTKAIAEAVK
jgi:RNA polymerase sigma factor (sigma-70 family)